MSAIRAEKLKVKDLPFGPRCKCNCAATIAAALVASQPDNYQIIRSNANYPIVQCKPRVDK